MQRQSLTTSHGQTRCPASPTAKVTMEELSAANFIAEHDVIWHGIALWPVQISCPSAAPSQLLAHSQPTPCRDKVRSRGSLLTLCMNIKISVISAQVWSQSRTQHRMGCKNKVHSIPWDPTEMLSMNKRCVNYENSKSMSLENRLDTMFAWIFIESVIEYWARAGRPTLFEI